MTVSARFATLLDWATPSSSQIRAYETHKASFFVDAEVEPALQDRASPVGLDLRRRAAGRDPRSPPLAQATLTFEGA